MKAVSIIPLLRTEHFISTKIYLLKYNLEVGNEDTLYFNAIKY